MSGTKRRRPGTAQSPEAARGQLVRKLFLLYDAHSPFRSALVQLALEHRTAVAMCGPRPLLTPTGRPVLEVSWATGEAVPGREVRWYPSWHQVRTDLAASEPEVADYVAALEAFAAKWGLARLGVVPLPEPPVQLPTSWPANRPFPSVHQRNAERSLEQPGVVAVHDWCLFYHAGGRDHVSVAFGAGHVITSLSAGVDTDVRVNEFVGRWNPDREPLTDFLCPVPEHLLPAIGGHSSVRLRSVKGQQGWYIPTDGARTRLRKAAAEALGRRLTTQEKDLIDAQLARIEAEFAASQHRFPDTAPEEDLHLRWTFLRLAPVGSGGLPLGVWKIAFDEDVDEKTVRNATDRMRRRLGLDRFPTAPRKPEHRPRSRT